MKTRSLFIFVVIIGSILSACSPEPLSELDLEPILVLPGDLPAGFSTAQVKDSLHSSWENYPNPDLIIDQRFQKQGNTSGGVIVLLYEDEKSLNKMYEWALENWVDEFGELSDPGIGEKSIAAVSYLVSDLVFIRCKALVDITLVDEDGIVPERDIASYAKRLDERLQKIVCR